MKIIQVINTNTIVVNDNGKKLVLMGKNIGFKKKPGQEPDISISLVEKVFEESEENIEK